MTIRVRNGKFLLISGSGKVLGSHPTRREAESQEKAVQISKARAAGHQIPRK